MFNKCCWEDYSCLESINFIESSRKIVSQRLNFLKNFRKISFRYKTQSMFKFDLFYSYRNIKHGFFLKGYYRNCHSKIELPQKSNNFYLEDYQVENKFERHGKKNPYKY